MSSGRLFQSFGPTEANETVSYSYEKRRAGIKLAGSRQPYTTTRQQMSNAAKKVRQISRCSAVQSLVYKDRQFESDVLRLSCYPLLL